MPANALALVGLRPAGKPAAQRIMPSMLAASTASTTTPLLARRERCRSAWRSSAKSCSPWWDSSTKSAGTFTTSSSLRRRTSAHRQGEGSRQRRSVRLYQVLYSPDMIQSAQQSRTVNSEGLQRAAIVLITTATKVQCCRLYRRG